MLFTQYERRGKGFWGFWFNILFFCSNLRALCFIFWDSLNLFLRVLKILKILANKQHTFKKCFKIAFLNENDQVSFCLVVSYINSLCAVQKVIFGIFFTHIILHIHNLKLFYHVFFALILHCWRWITLKMTKQAKSWLLLRTVRHRENVIFNQLSTLRGSQFTVFCV